jgi:hypothetical protein
MVHLISTRTDFPLLVPPQSHPHPRPPLEGAGISSSSPFKGEDGRGMGDKICADFQCTKGVLTYLEFISG